jgi:hypothetical protein|tara:strand:+ start:764 stop:1081 length:318 start_codon:yes stop_codon:yes gene_type:complete
MARRALFSSDRSGFVFKYSNRVKEPGTGYIVGPNESDGYYNLKDHPQNKSPRITPRRPLREARPDRVNIMTSVVDAMNATRASLGLTSITTDDGWTPDMTVFRGP